jgi:membrane protease YdiL (CAAX protease family)
VPIAAVELGLWKTRHLLALALVSSPLAKESTNRIRVGPILIGCLLGFLLGEIVASVLVALSASVAHYPGGFNALSKSNSPPWWSNVFGLVGLWCGFVAAIFFAFTQGNLKPLPEQWRLRPSDVVFVVLGVACQFGVDLLYYPFHFKHFNGPVKHLFGGAHGASFVLLVIMTTFLAPFFEEWFFRGVLYRALDEGIRRKLPRGGATVAVVLSACAFGLAHGELLQFVGLALFGVVLALVLRRTQRLVPSIITHMSFNAVAMVGLIIQRSGH